MLPSSPNLSFSSCALEIGGRLFERKVVQSLAFLPRYSSYCHRMIIPHLWVILIWLVMLREAVSTGTIHTPESCTRRVRAVQDP